MSVCVCTCVYIYIETKIHVLTYMNIYIYMCTSTHIYIYMHTVCSPHYKKLSNSLPKASINTDGNEPTAWSAEARSTAPGSARNA